MAADFSNIAIIFSKEHFAGLNIKSELLKDFSFSESSESGSFESDPVLVFNQDKRVKVYTTETRSVFCEHIDEKFKADLLIFQSTHRSQSGMRTLTCHVPGNFASADLGGEEKTLCIAPAVFLKQIYHELCLNASLVNVPPTLEVTHHGPALNTPVVFVEIGSDESAWKDQALGKAIAHSIMDAIKNYSTLVQKSHKIFVGIGGPHYAPQFNVVQQKENVAIGHMIPKHMLANVDRAIIDQAIKKTLEPVDGILLDYKGLGPQKQRILALLKDLDIKVMRTSKLSDSLFFKIPNSETNLNRP